MDKRKIINIQHFTKTNRHLVYMIEVHITPKSKRPIPINGMLAGLAHVFVVLPSGSGFKPSWYPCEFPPSPFPTSAKKEDQFQTSKHLQTLPPPNFQEDECSPRK